MSRDERIEKLKSILREYDDGADREPVDFHLGELYESAMTYQQLIDDLLDQTNRASPTGEALQELLSKIYVELYQHWLWHAKKLRAPLDSVLRTLSQQVPSSDGDAGRDAEGLSQD